MKTKVFRASTMPEVMQLVREQLGPEAVIVSRKRIRTRGFLGFFRRVLYEVQAAVELESPIGERRLVTGSRRITSPRAAVETYQRAGGRAEPQEPRRQAPSPTGEPRTGAPGPRRPTERPTERRNRFISQTEESLANLQRELKELRGVVDELSTTTGGGEPRELPGPLAELWSRLHEQEVRLPIINKVFHRLGRDLSEDQLQAPKVVWSQAGAVLRHLVEVSGPLTIAPGTCRTVALVGPTGVGKTTTLAKLASNYVLAGQTEGRIAFVTVDTYRIAATDQLKVYAEILNCPIEIVYKPEEMAQTLALHRDKDLVLIDTAGRSQRNEARIEELKEFMDAANPDEIHLVLAATSRVTDLEEIIERFDCIPFTHLLFTKIDEATRYGCLLDIYQRTRKPLSYITTGQNVPEDIEVASRSHVPRLILQEAEEAQG